MKLESGEEKTVKLMMAWHVPNTNLRSGLDPVDEDILKIINCSPDADCCPDVLSQYYYQPWYSVRFKNIDEVIRYWS